MPTANTSRAALQDLALLLDELVQQEGNGDFALTLGVTAGAQVVGGPQAYWQNAIQRMTMNPQGQLRVIGDDPQWTLPRRLWASGGW